MDRIGVPDLWLNNEAIQRDGYSTDLITEDTIVLTFYDLSQLVGTARTVVCLLPDGTQGVLSDGDWTSGTRRFSNVTGGKFRISSTATPQSANRQFYSTEGYISGRLRRR